MVVILCPWIIRSEQDPVVEPREIERVGAIGSDSRYVDNARRAFERAVALPQPLAGVVNRSEEYVVAQRCQDRGIPVVIVTVAVRIEYHDLDGTVRCPITDPELAISSIFTRCQEQPAVRVFEIPEWEGDVCHQIRSGRRAIARPQFTRAR